MSQSALDIILEDFKKLKKTVKEATEDFKERREEGTAMVYGFLDIEPDPENFKIKDGYNSWWYIGRLILENITS